MQRRKKRKDGRDKKREGRVHLKYILGIKYYL